MGAAALPSGLRSAPAGAASVAASDRWLFGAAPDLLLGCGLLYVILYAAHAVAGLALVRATPIYLLPLCSLLFSTPHYGGTLVRVYEQRRDRRAYAVFSIWITLGLCLLFLASLGRPFLASILFTLYLTWSPWHYSGQNYGLAVMFLRRRGVEVEPRTKRWLYATFMLSFVLAALVSHLEVGAAYSPLAYEGHQVTFLPIGITRGFGNVALPIVGAAYLTSVLASAFLLRRVASWRNLGPAFALMLTQSLWFAAPFWVKYWGWRTGLAPLDLQTSIANFAAMVIIAHGIQYLWITTYYARAGAQWHGYSNYWAKVAAAGLAVWTLPGVLLYPLGFGGSADSSASVFALVATFVNLHHFVLDGAIWKLRNTRIAAVLIRSRADEGGEVPASSPWRRRLVWTAASVGLVAGFGGYGAVYLYMPWAIARGDLANAEVALNVGGWLGSDAPALRVALVKWMLHRGESERAAAYLNRLVAAHPSGEAYALLGQAEAASGRPDAAKTAYETALANKTPHPDRVHVALARLALRAGRDSVAAEHYRSAIQLQPRSAAIANDFAWLLATAQDPAVRDVDTSLAVAEQLVKVSEEPRHFNSLAAAYAAAGRYGDAVGAASRAAELAEQRRDTELLADIRRNLARYRASQPAIATYDGLAD